MFLLPYGGGERVCLGKALAELEIRLLAVGLLKQLTLGLELDQDLKLAVIPSPSPKDGLLVRPRSRTTAADLVGSSGAEPGGLMEPKLRNWHVPLLGPFSMVPETGSNDAPPPQCGKQRKSIGYGKLSAFTIRNLIQR